MVQILHLPRTEGNETIPFCQFLILMGCVLCSLTASGLREKIAVAFLNKIQKCHKLPKYPSTRAFPPFVSTCSNACCHSLRQLTPG